MSAKGKNSLFNTMKHTMPMIENEGIPKYTYGKKGY
jgi:hypothetical protein